MPPPRRSASHPIDDPDGWWAVLWGGAAVRHYRQIPPGDRVDVDVRRHPMVLAVPAFRTAVAFLLLSGTPATGTALVFFLASCVLYVRQRHWGGWRTAVLTATVLSALLLVFGNAQQAVGLRVLVALALFGWLLYDLADWHLDRLVVTNQRIYRLYGVVTTHGPSISLLSITFIDPLEGPLGRLLGYGSLLLDSAAQEDQPLARFDFLPNAVGLQVRILELRLAAMTSTPPWHGG